ncbi:MAG: hypothetical protein IJ915_02855 [Paludibacteraceae bacterium]|nr:hypothetical protein [Paludibacteraceae bacterium]
MEEKRIRTYEEVFGISKEALYKGCARLARYDVLTGASRSYRTIKKYYKRCVKYEYCICGGTRVRLPWLLIFDWKVEKEELDERCYAIIEFSDYSEEDVIERARIYNESKKQATSFFPI